MSMLIQVAQTVHAAGRVTDPAPTVITQGALYHGYSCAAFLHGAAESRDEFEGGQPPRRAGQQDIPCFDPATGTYLGALPAMAPDEVSLTHLASVRNHQA
jgi:hypothetical protein